jgi:O-antigen ligase
MNPTPHFVKLETALLFTMGMVIFLSKPAIYLVCLLLLILTTLRILTDSNYRQAVFEKKLFWASTGLFFLGIASAAISSEYIEDAGWIAKKTLLLPMVVPLLIGFKNNTNRTAAITGIITGFWIALILTGQLHNWTWSGQRLEGATWLVDTWGLICAMLTAFLIPLLFHKNMSLAWRLIIALTMFASIIMLLLNGARGPLLGTACGLALYLLIKQLRIFVISASSITIIMLTLYSVNPAQISPIKERISSITDLDSNSSNYIRIALWETGIKAIGQQIKENDIRFLAGNGHTGQVTTATNFYRNELNENALIRPGILNKTLINDFHNMYIQSIYQNGAVWTAGVLWLLLWIGIGKITQTKSSAADMSGLATITCYFVTGITYTLLPHFAFLFLIFFLTLNRSQADSA